MTNKAWLRSDQQLAPGTEIFQSDRRFLLWAYTVSHGQLLLRSVGRSDLPGEPETTIDLLFKPATVLKIRDDYRGLAIRCATTAESEIIKAENPSVTFGRDDHVFLLESQGETDHIVAMAAGWHEDVLSRTSPGFFNTFYPDMPVWPTKPLSGVDAGFNIASAEELVEALRTDEQELIRREQYRHVYVVMTRVNRGDEPDVTGAGVFLTRADAEDAQSTIMPQVADCWIEELPIAI
ncbi:hypothetical protein ACFU76_27505 [Streptomyces sp. NPDC057539]|uniref:hypothetical protein n=1 Tax=Streptomyces sp. NPDC057539 TaxID=3346159 RepID=UPI0036A6528D